MAESCVETTAIATKMTTITTVTTTTTTTYDNRRNQHGAIHRYIERAKYQQQWIDLEVPPRLASMRYLAPTFPWKLRYLYSYTGRC